jgi:lantibiotic modifying enzyme
METDALDAKALLQSALEAEAFIDAQRVTPENSGPSGRWRQHDGDNAPADLSLYHGAAGIALLELELFRATGNPRYSERAVAAGETCAARLADKSWASVAFATGWPGYAFVLETIAAATDSAMLRDAAIRCIDRLLAQSQSIGAGIGWIEPMPFSDITGKTGDREIFDLSVGAAGAGVYLLHAARTGLHSRALAAAVGVGDRLLDVGEETDHGTRWGLMADMPFPFTAPNFAHGGAGVGYFLAQLFDATADQRYLDAALAAARYVVSKTTDVGSGGRLVCHTEEQVPPIFYLGECHGPAGTWRLLATLARLTGDTTWLVHADALLAGIVAIGAPTTRSAGWWNNHSQCCGDAGLGDSALAMAQQTGNSDYHDLAVRCAAVITAHSSLDGGRRSWEQAEHRMRPKFVQRQTGYMQGAAGIASFLLHLATPEARVWFPDERL